MTALLLLLACAAPGSARADDPGGGDVVVHPPLSWEQARDRLLVQLRAVDDRYAEGALFRQDIPFTRTVLMVALDGAPDTARDVTIPEAAPWRQRPEDLFRRAIANLLHRFPPEVHATPELRHGVKVNLLYGEHPFAAAYALSLEEQDVCMGRKGALLAVPNRHGMLCYPVESTRAFHAYLALVNMAVDIDAAGHAPIAPHVYWFHDGVFETQQVIVEETRFRMERTPAFEKLLEELPRDIHDPRPRPRW